MPKRKKVGRLRLPKSEAKGHKVPVRFTADDLKAMESKARERSNKQFLSGLGALSVQRFNNFAGTLPKPGGVAAGENFPANLLHPFEFADWASGPIVPSASSGERSCQTTCLGRKDCSKSCYCV